MTFRTLTAISAAALTLGLSAATQALAAPAEPQGDYRLRVAPPPANPHDYFRPVEKVPGSPAPRDHARAADCDCPMMKGDAAMRDMCMSMGRHGSQPKG
ncbi:hypothetical protein [Phenylobacterium sp. 58.2.17]|jgi:hypothetical protein|uniref:hypothetical protein n=1 Tax=Phenylobacterium sp. 58.2.17 TaxID=2969306 RepID=UPI002264D4E4|nr:hypothetical protein [Phenylobacterium sp. 58.2.17]MCX7588228.1 hypothetical protein [Phenylobacterium sp. 58.2.17]